MGKKKSNGNQSEQKADIAPPKRSIRAISVGLKIALPSPGLPLGVSFWFRGEIYSP